MVLLEHMCYQFSLHYITNYGRNVYLECIWFCSIFESRWTYGNGRTARNGDHVGRSPR